MKNILVTGGAGYIGSVLVPLLVKEGYAVTVIDKCTFGNNIANVEGITLHKSDILDMDPRWLQGIDTVIHLAGLSNDPMANFRPRDNFIDNNAVTSLLLYLCKIEGIQRFIFGSTCSVYGYSADIARTESDPVMPKFPYGISKVQSEQNIMSAAEENFHPLIFRQATVYGWAPRMRFDLVVNTMTKYAVTQGVINVKNPDLWRPLVHVQDLARAYLAVLEDDTQRGDVPLTGIFNIAHKNYTILEIGQQVQKALEQKGIACELDIGNEHDIRNYRVSNEKFVSTFNFHPQINIEQAVHEIVNKLGDASNPGWNNPWFINAEVYKKKVLKDEKYGSLWKNFLQEMEDDTDLIKWQQWPQEGP